MQEGQVNKDSKDE